MALQAAELAVIVEWLTKQHPTKAALRAALAGAMPGAKITTIREAESVFEDGRSIVMAVPELKRVLQLLHTETP